MHKPRNPFAFMSGLALLAAGKISEAELANWRRNHRTPKGQGNRYRPRSRHYPHQGTAEIARRKSQLASGTLRAN